MILTCLFKYFYGYKAKITLMKAMRALNLKMAVAKIGVHAGKLKTHVAGIMWVDKYSNGRRTWVANLCGWSNIHTY